MPPIYWSTFIQYAASTGSVGVSAWGAVKRAKYQDKSTKVSIVSVSRSAAPPQLGQVQSRQVGCQPSGLPGLSKLTSSGRRTGRFSFFSGTTPQASQWITGIGAPQKRWRDSPQSRRRNLVTPWPTPFSSQKVTAASIASFPVCASSPAKPLM